MCCPTRIRQKTGIKHYSSIYIGTKDHDIIKYVALAESGRLNLGVLSEIMDNGMSH
jgi:hypothetical protein